MKTPFPLCVAVAGALLVCSDAQALGRLFTTEEQRHQLEHPSDQQAQLQPQPANNAEPVLLNGFVKSQQGHKTLWINGNMYDKPIAGRVIVDADGRRVVLKPGQMLDRSHHEIREVFDQPTVGTVNAEEAPAASQTGVSDHQSGDAP